MFLVPSPAVLQKLQDSKVKEALDARSDMERMFLENIHQLEAVTERYRAALKVIQAATKTAEKHKATISRNGALLALSLVAAEVAKALGGEDV